jgi:pyrroloquinoline quinone biosynthesis protein A
MLSAWPRGDAQPSFKEMLMTWETPAYCELRLGFEVTAYVYVR